MVTSVKFPPGTGVAGLQQRDTQTALTQLRGLGRGLDRSRLGSSPWPMMKNSILFAGLGLWSAVSPAQAKLPSQATSGVQVLDFSQSLAVSQTQMPATPQTRVRAAMVASFTGEAVERPNAIELTNPSGGQVVFDESRQNQAASFVRSPVIAVPPWMRRGNVSLAMQVLPPNMPSIGNCGAARRRKPRR